MKKIFTAFLFLYLCLNVNATIIINEVMSSNSTTLLDEDASYTDWIEIYNDGEDSINLEGYFLSDIDTELMKWQFPDTIIAPESYMIIFASGKDRDVGELHTNFKISSSGEELFLMNADGDIIDQVFAFSPEEDISLARTSGGWELTILATPGSANEVDVYPYLYLSKPAGVYTDEIYVSVNANTPGDIRYTLDGSTPTYTSPILTDSILLTSRALDTNYYSMIPSSVDFSPPSENVFKINTLRAACFDGEDQITPSLSATYFIDNTICICYIPPGDPDASETLQISKDSLDSYLADGSYIGTCENGPKDLATKYSIPIVSLIIDPSYLFHVDTGMYVPGTSPGTGPWFTAANYYTENREVPAHFEYINVAGQMEISHDIGLKLHGGLTRGYSQKSLKLIARSEYGQGEFEYDFFNGKTITEFDRLVMRNGGQDIVRAMFRDAFVHEIVKDCNLEVMHSNPTVLFLNGEYWGIHNMREKLDEHHIENLYGIDRDSIDLLQSNADVIHGENTEYLEMMDFVYAHDLSIEENYEYMKSQMDIDNFIDYYSIQLFFQNREWPHNNIKFWKEKGEDGRWRWILFDLDITSRAWGVCGAENNAYDWVSEITGYPVWSRILFLKLIENDIFKYKFVNRFADLQNTVLEKQYTKDVLEDFKQYYSFEVYEHLERWNHIPSHLDWLNRVGVVNEFLDNRESFCRLHTREYFELGDETVEVELLENISGAGTINFSTLQHEVLPWDGIYYKTSPIELKAEANPGYVFSHWLETGDSSNVITVVLDSDTSFTAVYNNAYDAYTGIVINEIQASNNYGLVDEAGENEDWIELYNDGPESVELNNLYLSDDPGDPCKWKFQFDDAETNTFNVGEYALVFADRDTMDGNNHTNFKLPKSGGFLGLFQVYGMDTITLDMISFDERISDVSFGRYPNATGEFRNMVIPSPGSVNETKPYKEEIVINEVLAKNETDITDEAGEYEDWIEIYNYGSETINMAGYFLTDDPEDPLKWKIRTDSLDLTSLGPEAFMLFYADNEIDQGRFHLPFKLSASGETLQINYLDNNTILTVYEIEYNELEEDQSFGCYPDASEHLEVFLITTPNASNISGTVNIVEMDEIQIQIYPNPFDDTAIIDFGQNLAGENQVLVHNAIGQEVYRNENIVGRQLTLKKEDLGRGLYLLSVMSEAGVYVVKMIVQ